VVGFGKRNCIVNKSMEQAAYRIIDANFNRAREALRVIEEYCRFVLNSALLTSRAKQLRHELCATISGLDSGRLISGRDAFGDVGAGRTIEQQFERVGLTDVFTAACKRLSEALRAIAEVAQIENRCLAQDIEKLRFTAYTLEKDIVLFSRPAEKFRRVRLYVIIDSNLPAEVISLTQKCAEGGADCVQLRAKNISDDTYLAMATEFVRFCKDAGVLSIINDRVDIAVIAGADGVHLGQNDLSVEQARKLQLSPLIIGKSTHSLEELNTVLLELPTYVSLGPVFATPTKPMLDAVGLEYVRQAMMKLADTGVYGVAIGGITAESIEQVLKTGIRTVAVCSAVTKVAHSVAACRELKEKIFAL
jgi:thiamine-phosphate pyrophosphorylase